MQPLLWDTCTAIWIYEKARLSQAALEAMGAAYREGVPSYVSPITAWEVGMLTAHGRLQLLIRPERWFSNLFEVPGVRLAEMSPDLLIASSYLPGSAEGPDGPDHCGNSARAWGDADYPRPGTARLRRARARRGAGVLNKS